jgi:succinoglycan biosynthesis transport protein ExoP
VETNTFTEHPDEESLLREWLAVLSRQKWIVLLAVVAVPLLAFATSRKQQHVYEASATVLVKEQNPTAEALNLGSGVASPPDRFSATQADLARVGTVAEMAVRDANLRGHSAAGLLASSSVTADPSADLLAFSVRDPVPAAAVTLANAYAKQFTLYRQRLDATGLSAAVADIDRKLSALSAAGSAGSLSFRRLAATKRDLEQLQTIQSAGPGAILVGPAGTAVLVQPKTRRNVILGVLVGLALGIALAFLRESLDTRVRSVEELRARLGLPVLAQVPAARRHTPTRRLATLAQPAGSSTEAYRILKNNLEVALLERHVGSIVMTSPLEVEGKSGTAANLAVILARAGRHVILADFDLRHPRIDELFGVRYRAGLAGVAAGVELADALSVVDVSTDRPGGPYTGKLEILTAGQPPQDPGEFLSSRFVPEVLGALAERCDLLLIETPPMLSVGDAMVIAKHSDAVILVAQVNQLRRETLAETRRVLDACPALKLGVIAAARYPRERAGFAYRARTAPTGTNAEHPASEALSRRPLREASIGVVASISALVDTGGGRLSSRKRWHGRASRDPGHGDLQESAPQVPDA